MESVTSSTPWFQAIDCHMWTCESLTNMDCDEFVSRGWVGFVLPCFLHGGTLFALELVAFSAFS